MSNKSVKYVSVTIDAAGNPVCTPSTAVINGGDVLLVFKLDVAGYAFPAQGAIVLSQPSSQFPYPSWTMNSSAASLFDANSATGTFSYTVNVLDLVGNVLVSHDPSIENRPS